MPTVFKYWLRHMTRRDITLAVSLRRRLPRFVASVGMINGRFMRECVVLSNTRRGEFMSR